MEISELITLVNPNFAEGGYWGTLAYDVENAPENVDEAEDDLKEWLNGQEIKELKYVAVISKGKERMCIHFIADFPDRDSAEKVIWGKGRSVVNRLNVNDENRLSERVRYMCSGEVIKILLSFDRESNDSK